ncbi:MAG TPA: phytanoyl-CoA dioxygenase family protein [Allosphingosinicella sp.]|nr:phytanoyl-CoA dioxygenase family protein [Allosphingosinicella sp.]
MTSACLADVPGLEAYWAHATRRPGAAAPAEMDVRLLLDTLGLGIEQTGRFLEPAPPFGTFTAWIEAQAGTPDPLRLERYRAWHDGREPPEPVCRQQRALADAPPVLDEADLARWDEDGYAILRRAIAPEEARAAEQLLWQAVGAGPDDPESWYGARRGGIMVPVYQHPALEPARRAPRIHKAFAQLWGREDLWMTTDRMSFNPPERPFSRFQGPKLHWDVSLAWPIPFATQGILYLTDTGADQGAFRLVPGFHRRIRSWLEGLGDADPRRVDLEDEAIGIAAAAGDLIIWRWDLPHGASPNRSNRPRMAQYVNMYPADLVTNPVWR